MKEVLEHKSILALKLEIQREAKKGVDFLLAAGLLWLLISFIWTWDQTSYNKSIFTFMVGALLLPLAFGLSNVLKTTWKIKNNPLQPLGLWLNFAQLIYFPISVFMLIKFPDYFILVHAIITSAHLFPYVWLYDELGCAVAAIFIAAGSLVLALLEVFENTLAIPLLTALTFLCLAAWILLKGVHSKS